MPSMYVTADNWYQLADVAEQRAGCSLTTWEGCCVYYNLCAASVVTHFSIGTLNLWKRLNGINGCNYEEYWQLPALYVEICELIETEIVTIQNKAKGEPVVKDVLSRKRY